MLNSDPRYNQFRPTLFTRSYGMLWRKASAPTRSSASDELCMSGRTLQRRREEEATSFIELLDDTRHEFAEQHLGLRRLLIPATLWFDQSPAQYRSLLRRDKGPEDGAALGGS